MSIRVLRTAKATLQRSFYLDEVATAATGAVTVSVTRLDGTVVESGSATGPGVGNVYSYLFGGRDVVDELVITWSGTFGGDLITYDQDRIEVVGGFLFSLAEGRAVDPALASSVKFPTADLADYRTATEAEAERICGQAFVPRFRRVTVNGTGRPSLMMPDPLIRAIRSVKVNGVTFDVGSTALVGFSDAGMIYLSSGWIQGVPTGLRNITIEYEHGWDAPPTDIVRASKLRFKSMALRAKSALPDTAERVITVDQQGGTVVYGSPSIEKVGIPEVDAAYGRFPSPRPGFG
jgi:hypothetical protein